MRILTQQFGSQSLNLLDIGCGGGDLCFLAAEAGHQATGIDQSEAMIKHAENLLRASPDEIRARLRFVRTDLRALGDELQPETYDTVIAMGVIYYLPEDDALFTCARDLLNPGGLLMVSCRNRLFNMFSISDYTVKEIEGHSALDLIAKIQELWQPIPEDNSALFLENIKQSITQFLSEEEQRQKENKLPIATKEDSTMTEYTFDIEGRQHTPNQLTTNAAKFCFVNVGYYGVHPHLLIPKLNRSLPPQVFNQLSDSLFAFENLPISLIWSSQFIGVFEKK